MMVNFNDDGRYTYHQGNPSTTADGWDVGVPFKSLFRQTAGSAFAAIREITDELNVTEGECAGAIMACVWYGVSRSMAEPNFNQRYPGMNALNMDFERDDSWKRNLAGAKDADIHIPGDWLYFKGHNYKDGISVKYFYERGWLVKDTKKEDILLFW